MISDSSPASCGRLRNQYQYHGVLLVAAPIVQLGKKRRFLRDLAHRNQTNASCDAQIRGTMSTASSVSIKVERPFPRREKRGRSRGEVELPAQLKMAGGVGEATRAA